ncbi:hypothetical protein [Planctomyces sp. SH-PL62]|nr:hypothetical protein [Planctomyces sp. SH-PL62]AMV38425.1 hypothetical protein VT85_13390 [Planctomyces sp. SH-PL62]
MAEPAQDVGRASPTAPIRPSTVRAFADRSQALSMENIRSIGLKTCF